MIHKTMSSNQKHTSHQTVVPVSRINFPHMNNDIEPNVGNDVIALLNVKKHKLSGDWKT
jgi:hypothetical protein